MIHLLILLMGSSECAPDTTVPPNKARQAKKAEAALEDVDFSENAEIDNIQRRLDLTSSPGLLGYIVLFNGTGAPIKYTTVKGKVTSGNKRLSRPWSYENVWPEYNDGSTYLLVEAPSDEGTYGSSNPYIYFWTQSGEYVQWSGDYLYSDKPIRLSIAPVVIDILDTPPSPAAPAVVVPVPAPVPVEITPILPPPSNG